jgi:hypothetical protein
MKTPQIFFYVSFLSAVVSGPDRNDKISTALVGTYSFRRCIARRISVSILHRPFDNIRLKGGAKHKKTRARSWKEHGEHHRRIRQASIKKNRGVVRPKHYTKDAIKALEKQEDEQRLKEIEERLAKKEKLAEDFKMGVAHQLRKYYMQVCAQQDEEREKKYRTLDDYSDPVERELEELRLKRGESRFLTEPDWRKEHPTYWKEIDRLTRDEKDLDDPDKVALPPLRFPAPSPPCATQRAPCMPCMSTSHLLCESVIYSSARGPAVPSPPAPPRAGLCLTGEARAAAGVGGRVRGGPGLEGRRLQPPHAGPPPARRRRPALPRGRRRHHRLRRRRRRRRPARGSRAGGGGGRAGEIRGGAVVAGGRRRRGPP